MFFNLDTYRPLSHSAERPQNIFCREERRKCYLILYSKGLHIKHLETKSTKPTLLFSSGLLWQPLPICSCPLISPPHWTQRILLKNKQENKTIPSLTAFQCLPSACGVSILLPKVASVTQVISWVCFSTKSCGDPKPWYCRMQPSWGMG